MFWWGEKNSLSVIDLGSLSITEYPMAIGLGGVKLVTYDIMVIKQKVIYIMYEDDDYKMIYLYDMLKKELQGGWRYSNDECKENCNFNFS